MNKAQYVIELTEMWINELEDDTKKALKWGTGLTAGGYAVKKGIEYLGKKGKESIESGQAGKNLRKIKKHYDTAKEIAGK